MGEVKEVIKQAMDVLQLISKGRSESMRRNKGLATANVVEVKKP